MSTESTTHPVLAPDGLGLEGFDPVSYFRDGPVRGQEAYEVAHGGATYRFASAENRDTFLSDPEAYLPQYGGYCATALSEGKLVPANPERYTITDGRLFVFYKTDEADTLPEWQADEADRTQRADRVWADRSFVEV